LNTVPAACSHSACIGLGSNLGQSRQLLQDAWAVLAADPQIIVERLSSPYQTSPVGMESSHLFVNAAGLLTTSMEPEKLLTVLLAVEEQFGRIRSTGCAEYQDRTLDLDLLLYDALIQKSGALTLPHPLMHKRLFVLVPLAEIVPDEIHPNKGQSIAALLAGMKSSGSDCTDIKQLHW
jgi:2-amino-4-hydroxy-6-hydroxymethyldihydropteridine diphosphokinase